jgi:predicted RNA-binding protein with RPS1 domain
LVFSLTLEKTVDALIHVSDLSWTKKNINPNDEFKVGTRLKAVVVTVDKDNSKFCLGIKQLRRRSLEEIEERLPVGSVVEGEVVRVTDFGAFVELETGIEGLIHISELSEDRVEKLMMLFFSRASAVTIKKGRPLSDFMPRTFFNNSKPSISGIFQSEMTKQTGLSVLFDSMIFSKAGTPSSASITF